MSGLSVKSSDNNISYGIQWNGPDHILPGLPIGSSASYFYWLTPLHPCRGLEYPPPHVFNFFIHNMLCFNYIANIIKLMGLLSREGMRDGDIGICWDAGHIGICGICGICGTDHLPEIGPAVLPFFGPPPLACINHKIGTANYQLDEKRMFIFRLTC